jgi:hypothetical protein
MVRPTTALPSGRAVVTENRRFMDLCAPPENTEHLADRRKPEVGRNLRERFRDLLACDPNVERGVDVVLERSVRANSSVAGAQINGRVGKSRWSRCRKLHACSARSNAG